MSENEKNDGVVDAGTEVVEEVKSQEQDASELRMGIKEVASNSDAIAIEKNKVESTENKEKVPESLPSFFVDKTSMHRIEVDILSSKEDGKIMSISRVGMGLDFENDFNYLRHSKEWFEFTIPTYEDMSSYRTRCATYHREVGQMLVDKLKLRNYMLVWHIKNWSLTDKSGNKIVLTHDADGSLDDASMKVVYSVHPTILDVILTILEKDVLLT